MVVELRQSLFDFGHSTFTKATSLIQHPQGCGALLRFGHHLIARKARRFGRLQEMDAADVGIDVAHVAIRLRGHGTIEFGLARAVFAVGNPFIEMF